jgi:uncharacterized membrane protein
LSKRNRNRQLPPPTAVQQGLQHRIVAQRQELRIAPLPTPDELAHYEAVLPGLANRIVTMAEQNGHDRRKTNRTIRWATILGQLFAFVTVIAALSIGFYLVNGGKDVAGVSTLIAAIGVPLGVLVYNRTRSPHP